MRRLLRDRKTRQYFAPHGNWTQNATEAYHFSDVTALIQRAIALEEYELEEVLMFSEQPSCYDVVLPVRLKSHALRT